jgi:hypothetical protein
VQAANHKIDATKLVISAAPRLSTASSQVVYTGFCTADANVRPNGRAQPTRESLTGVHATSKLEILRIGRKD